MLPLAQLLLLSLVLLLLLFFFYVKVRFCLKGILELLMGKLRELRSMTELAFIGYVREERLLQFRQIFFYVKRQVFGSFCSKGIRKYVY